MPDLLTHRVWNEITSAAIACTRPSDVAVAYFGVHGPRLLPLAPGSRLVVDASIPTIQAGSTCPAALERLRRSGTEVFSAQFLHAKVCVFDRIAFVGSANASQRSERVLTEAVFRLNSKIEVASARDFVRSLCVTRLSENDLVELGRLYLPPTPPPVIPIGQTHYATLIMELTNEQGGGRESQVQPPKAVWESYFGIRVGFQALPLLVLVNESNIPSTETERNVVKHDHNYTIEIAGSGLPRPAILEMRRVDERTFRYKVHRPNHLEFQKMYEILHSYANPLRRSGRRWVVI